MSQHLVSESINVIDAVTYIHCCINQCRLVIKIVSYVLKTKPNIVLIVIRLMFCHHMQKIIFWQMSVYQLFFFYFIKFICQI